MRSTWRRVVLMVGGVAGVIWGLLNGASWWAVLVGVVTGLVGGFAYTWWESRRSVRALSEWTSEPNVPDGELWITVRFPNGGPVLSCGASELVAAMRTSGTQIYEANGAMVRFDVKHSARGAEQQ